LITVFGGENFEEEVVKSMTDNRQLKVAVTIFVVGFLLSVLVGVSTYTYYSKNISDIESRQLSGVSEKLQANAPMILKKSKTGTIPAKYLQEFKNSSAGVDGAAVINNKKVVVAADNKNLIGKSLSGMLKADRLPDIFSVTTTGYLQEQADNALYLSLTTPIFTKKNGRQKAVNGYLYVNRNTDKAMQKYTNQAVEMSLIIIGFSFIASALGYTFSGSRRLPAEGQIVVRVSSRDEKLSIVEEMTKKELIRARWIDPDLAMLHARQFGGKVR
jgi:hypothetical protein